MRDLAFRAELLVRRKHTRNGARNFSAAIAQAVMSLGEFRELEGARVKAMRARELRPEQADSLILQSFERGIISAPVLPRVIKEWRAPRYEEFEPRTAWSLLNAFTTALGDRATRTPVAFAVQTMRLNHLLEMNPHDSPALPTTAA